MKSITTFFIVSVCVVSLFSPATFGDGEVCTQAQKQQAEAPLKKAEDAEKAGRTQDAYAIVDRGIREIDCIQNGYKRRDGLIERTSKKLGAEAEKNGHLADAFKYFSAPNRHGRSDYPLADADRVMLKYAKANPDNFKVVSEAVAYFDRREGKPHLIEVRTLAASGGDKVLVKEEKSFAARRDTLGELQSAKAWLDLIGESRRVNARAVQRGDTLLAEGNFRSVEHAFRYYDFSGDKLKLKGAQGRARSLGDDAARKGDHGLAAKFYGLSGDEAKAAAVEKQKEQVEAKRQDKFKKDQKSLEKELGF